mmetsp:Transcript_35418/g.40222  ORF Transcript_35418/g.40222 Transcript_35418/m.40222 type:complete len:229 (-) Transcript_35418:302-988(-)
MCKSLTLLQDALNNEVIETATQGAAYKWSPLRSQACSCESKCEDATSVIEHIVRFFEKKIEPSIDETTSQRISEWSYNREADLFCEIERIAEQNHLSMEEKINLLTVPSRDTIYQFVSHILAISNITHELALFSLILLKRLLRETRWVPRAATWRILFLISIRVAQKTEEQSLLSAEKICANYPLFCPREIILLETTYLKLIDFGCFIELPEFASELQVACRKTSYCQ